MDFKPQCSDKPDKHRTPKNQSGPISKRLSNTMNVDSPFRSLPNYSTPPSRFAKILNPFEPHLIERLHLPTFSPNVFVQNSTPKTDHKFKWTIDDISSLKPADIDETTVSQHVCTTEDPQIESLVQQKIDTFFSEKEIVPSPMNLNVENAPLVKECSLFEETPTKKSYESKELDINRSYVIKETCEGATQTVLTLPPVLPKELEEALKPYFNYHEDQQQFDDNNLKNMSMYSQLFGFENKSSKSFRSSDDVHSLVSSPALSPAGISPVQFSPCAKRNLSPFDMPELKDCNLSPITKSPSKTRLSRSACRLDFSDKMSVDASLIVPDLDNQQMSSRSYDAGSPIKANDSNPDTTVNWSMEYKQILLGSPESSTGSERMDVSNSNTPHSKKLLGKGQRKRLSESFKSEDDENALQYGDIIVQNNRNKIFRNDVTDAGYHTQDVGDFSNNLANVFASTPSKRCAKI